MRASPAVGPTAVVALMAMRPAVVAFAVPGHAIASADHQVGVTPAR
jgi:hypothetical protein